MKETGEEGGKKRKAGRISELIASEMVPYRSVKCCAALWKIWCFGGKGGGIMTSSVWVGDGEVNMVSVCVEEGGDTLVLVRDR